MAILILLFSFISIILSIGVLSNRAKKKDIILYSVLIFSGLTVLITELLSCFYTLNFNNIFISWLSILAVNLFFLYQKKKQLNAICTRLKHEFAHTWLKIKSRKLYEKCLLFFVLIIVLLVFVQGIVYPPNNWDSMNYHVARIPSWISHQSVAHFPAHFSPQVYQPPFSEFVIMNFNILNKADYFSSAVQFLYLLFTIVVLIAIVENFGLSTSYKYLTIFLTLTIPEVILQATSTQNDIVVAFFVVSAFYLAIKSVKKLSLKQAFFFGLAVGLGILTKATAYIYMPSILLVFGITTLIRLYATRNYKYLLYGFVAGLMFLSVNLGFYTRNYQLTKSFLGVDSKEFGTYSNEKMNAKLLFLSITKNVGVHVGLYHLKPLSVFAAHSIIKLHQLLDVDVNDPANNFFSDKYDTLYNPDHEDAAPNFIHLILIILSIVIIIVQSFKKNIPIFVKLLAFTITFQFLFFCFYLKYQPFHTRLHTSIFLLSVPLICYALSITSINIKKLFYWFTPFMAVYAFLIVLGNLNTPYNAKIKQSRYQKYFISKPFLYDEYNEINNIINAKGYQNIGMITGSESWDYSFFTNCYSKPINPVYIMVTNYTNKAHHFDEKIDCIISTMNNKQYLYYHGKRFYNQDPKNKIIHLYE